MIDALRRALFLADLAGHAAQPCFPVRSRRRPETEKRAPPRQRQSAPPDTHRRQPFFGDIAAGEILRRLRQSLQNSFTQQLLPPNCPVPNPSVHYLSTSPSTISTLPKISTTSATLLPKAHIFQNRQVDQARRPHPIAIRIRPAVADQIKTKFALRRFNAPVRLARLRPEVRESSPSDP